MKNSKHEVRSLSIRILFFEFVSDFDIRISLFPVVSNKI